MAEIDGGRGENSDQRWKKMKKIVADRNQELYDTMIEIERKCKTNFIDKKIIVQSYKSLSHHFI